jgi:pSer/pThr/pTyr-binding forkhead associated (FHA) protein
MQSVFIKDIGSLHGTFFNNTRLKKHQAQVIKDGDLIQFGIPIDRGSEVNSACIMRAGIQFGTSRYVTSLQS